METKGKMRKFKDTYINPNSRWKLLQKMCEEKGRNIKEIINKRLKEIKAE